MTRDDPRLSEWLDGELPEEEAREWSRLVEGDSELAREQVRLEKTGKALRAYFSDVQANLPDLRDREESFIRTTLLVQDSGHVGGMRRWRALALVLVGVVSAGVGWWVASGPARLPQPDYARSLGRLMDPRGVQEVVVTDPKPAIVFHAYWEPGRFALRSDLGEDPLGLVARNLPERRPAAPAWTGSDGTETWLAGGGLSEPLRERPAQAPRWNPWGGERLFAGPGLPGPSASLALIAGALEDLARGAKPLAVAEEGDRVRVSYEGARRVTVVLFFREDLLEEAHVGAYRVSVRDQRDPSVAGGFTGMPPDLPPRSPR